MTYERDYKKIILYIFGCVGLVFGTLFISFVFLLGKVNAESAVFSSPAFLINYSDGTASSNLGNGVNQSWWGSNNYWGVLDAVHQGNFFPVVKEWYSYQSNFNMCSSSSYITISGQIAMLPNPGVAYYSNDTYYRLKVYVGEKEMSCSTSVDHDGWALNFQCTGENGQGLVIDTIIGNYYQGASYHIGLKKQFDYFCETGPSEIIVNQNNNTNQIIENNNYWSNLMAQHQENIQNAMLDAQVRHDIADGVLGSSGYQDSYGLSDIINLPLNLINHLTDSCSSITLPIPYINEDVTINCPSYFYSKMLGNTFVNLIATIINAFVIYRFLMVIVNSINNAKNPDNDKLEMIEL